MRLSFDGEKFIFRCAYPERDIPRRAFFLWDGNAKEWYTKDYRDAAKLRDYADGPAKIQLARVIINVSPWRGRIPHPPELTPYPFQVKAVRYAASRNRAYLGLDPGLGKTAVAAMVTNSLYRPFVYICPPSLVNTAKYEFRKWWLCPEDGLFHPDSLLYEHNSQRLIRDFAKDNPGSILFIDEAHRYKTPASERTRALFSRIVKGVNFDNKAYPEPLTDLFDRVYCLSGTPAPNQRPMELYPVLNALAPETTGFRNFHSFGLRYCNAFQTEFGWDYSGHSNTEELGAAVRNTFMLRMKKADVLPELPAKIEEVVIIGAHLPPRVVGLDQELRRHSPEDLMKHLAANGHLSTYRKELGAAKVGPAAQYIREILSDNPEESVIVFAHHKEAVKLLAYGLSAFTPIVITGDTPTGSRKGLADEFQDNPARRLFIGNIDACGIGFTLTKATRVIFAEFSWVPAANEQASDRAHRIGQKKSVLVQYLVFKNSVDRVVLESNLRKRKALKGI